MSTTPNRPAGLNRGLLTLVGILLLLGGAYTLVRGFAGIPAIGSLPAQDPDTALLADDLSVPTWGIYLALVIAAVIGLLSLMWLGAQIGRRRPGSKTWRLPAGATGPGDGATDGATLLDTDAASSAVADEIETYPGVHRAIAVITGERTDPVLRLTLTTEEDAPITELRRRIADDALPRLRTALELDELPTEILFRLGATAPARTS